MSICFLQLQEYLGTNRLEEEQRKRFRTDGMEHFADEVLSAKVFLLFFIDVDFTGFPPFAWNRPSLFVSDQISSSIGKPKAAHFSNALGCEAALLTSDEQLVLLRRSGAYDANCLGFCFELFGWEKINSWVFVIFHDNMVRMPRWRKKKWLRDHVFGEHDPQPLLHLGVNSASMCSRHI